MASLVQYDKYVAIGITGIIKILYYVIKFVSEAYTLQNSTTIDGKIITVGELFVKA